MSKKFLTVFALVALLIAAMAGAAFAISDDVTRLVASADAENNLTGVTGDVPAYEGVVYYIDNGPITELTVMLSVDFAAGASVAAYQLSADNDGSANVAAASKPAIGVGTDITKADTYTVTSADLRGEFKIVKIGTYNNSDGEASGDAKSADLTVTLVEAPALTLTNNKLQISPDAESGTKAEVGFGVDAKYAFNGKLGLFIDDVDVSTDKFTINEGNIEVSLDLAGAKVIFTVSGDGPGALTTEPFDFEFRLKDDGATYDDGLIAGISDDVASNVIGAFTVAVEEPTPPEVITITLNTDVDQFGQYVYDYVLGRPFAKSIDVTVSPARAEITAFASEVWEFSSTDILPQPSLAYNPSTNDLVFTGNVTVPGFVGYTISFDVSMDNAHQDVPVDFRLNSANGYIYADGPLNVVGAKDHDMNVVMPLSYNPTSLSADLKDAKFTVYVQEQMTDTAVLSGDKEVTWNGVKVTFDAANQKFTFSGRPTTKGLDAWAWVVTDKKGIMLENGLQDGLDRHIWIADVVYEVTSGIQVDGKNGTSMTIDKANPVSFPLRSGDVFSMPQLQLSAPDVIQQVGISPAATDARNGRYAPATGIISTTVTPAANGTYYFDASYNNEDSELVMERATLSVGSHDGGSSGCDMGFGAFALLGLAGAAALLRRKD